MKLKIINGKRYNTETATEVASYWNGLSNGDFNHCSETLYRTAKGAWFISGKGGARSRYSQSCGNNSWCGGSDIIVLDEADAQAWLEEHDEAQALETYFSDSLEDA